MKRFSLLILVMLFLFSLSACFGSGAQEPGDESTATPPTTTATEPTEETICQHVYDQEEVVREPSYGIPGHKIVSCSLCGDWYSDSVPELPDAFKLTVTKKYTYAEENEESHEQEYFVFLDVEIENLTDKKIESISGSLDIWVDNCLLSLDCSFEDLELEANSTKTISGYGFTFDLISESAEVEQAVYDAALEELSILFSPSEVILEE